MSVGTIVTIVLLMSVLVLGLVMIRTIFKNSTNNITAIDDKVRDQIKTLFSEDDTTPLVVYPSRELTMKKGKREGFGLAIRGDDTAGDYSYEIKFLDSTCNIPKTNAEGLIALGRESGEDIPIAGGDKMDEPELILFDIPDSMEPCTLRYRIYVYKDNGDYTNQNILVEIIGR